jgi:hypothetical protein
MTSSTTPGTAASNGGTTSEPAIEIPGYVTMVTPAQKRDIAALAGYIAELLTGNSDLPAPQYFSVSQHGQEVSFQFGDTRDSFRALAQWAERFGGTLTGEPHTYDGWQSVHCEVKFTDHGVNVVAYAYIKVAKAAPAAT